MPDSKANQENKNQSSVLISRQVGYGLTLCGWVAFPPLFGFFIGRYLVLKMNLPEYILYITIGLFVVLSFYGLIKSTMEYAKKVDK